MNDPRKPPALRRVEAVSQPWPLHDTAASRCAEQTARAGRPQPSLMARAGLSVARLALALAPEARVIRVWAGPGNNGGDAMVAARHLHAAGKAVQVVMLADPARLPEDAANAWRDAQAAGVAITDSVTGPDSDLAIDGLLGLGANRPPDGALAAAIDVLNGSGRPLLAVDVPSGLHSDTGALVGSAAVRATATLSLLTLKPGCFTAAGRDHAGAVWIDDLGVDAGPPTAWLAGRVSTRPRVHATNKGSFGDVAVVAGAPGMLGAAWLAARAALAAGAGRVYLSPLDDAAPTLDPLHPELIGQRAFWRCPPDQLASATVVCGCGGGDDLLFMALPPLLAHAMRLVLDADALNLIAGDAGLQRQLRARAGRGQHSLLTPHPLEAARLLQRTAAAVQADRLGAALEMAERFGCTVLLKGSGSIVAAPGRVPVVNPSGNAALASAGTGDVLAGWAGGLWAQDQLAHPAAVAAAAAWGHGRAADVWGPAEAGAPIRASDLIEALAARRWEP